MRCCPRRLMFNATVAFVGLLLVASGYTWATTISTQKYWMFLPAGDVVAGFGSFRGELQWVEYASWQRMYFTTEAVPWWSVCAAEGALLAALVVARNLSRQRRLTAGKPPCPHCNYDLRGDSTSGCPECGWRRESIDDSSA